MDTKKYVTLTITLIVGVILISGVVTPVIAGLGDSGSEGAEYTNTGVYYYAPVGSEETYTIRAEPTSESSFKLWLITSGGTEGIDFYREYIEPSDAEYYGIESDVPYVFSAGGEEPYYCPLLLTDKGIIGITSYIQTFVNDADWVPCLFYPDGDGYKYIYLQEFMTAMWEVLQEHDDAIFDVLTVSGSEVSAQFVGNTADYPDGGLRFTATATHIISQGEPQDGWYCLSKNPVVGKTSHIMIQHSYETLVWEGSNFTDMRYAQISDSASVNSLEDKASFMSITLVDPAHPDDEGTVLNVPQSAEFIAEITEREDGLMQLNSITATAQWQGVTDEVTFDHFIVPVDVSNPSSSEVPKTILTMLSVIPILLTVGLVIGAFAFVRFRQ